MSAARARRLGGRSLIAVALFGGLMATSINATATVANIQVTPDVPHSYQEPTLVVDPHNAAHLAVSYQDGLQKPPCGLSLSRDTGATWTNSVVAGPGGQLPLPAGYDTCRDTALSFGPEGTLYYVVQASDSNRFNVSTVSVTSSSDGGRTFAPLVPVAPSSTDTTDLGYYQPSIAVDVSNGRVSIAWLHYLQFSQDTVVETASSSDHGHTFSSPVRISPAEETKTGSVAMVAGSGRVVVAWLDATAWSVAKGQGGATPCPANGCPPLLAHVRTSTDNGASFGQMVTVDDHIASGANDPWRFSRLLTMTARASLQPLVIAWWEPQADLNRVVVARSSDRGAQWFQPQVVTPPAGHDADEQDRAMLAVAPNGRIDMGYADLTPADATGTRTQSIYTASSTDGGATFAAGQLVSDQASNASIGPARPPGGAQPPSDPSRGAWFGRHFGLSATDGSTLLVWADSRRGTLTDGRQDVLFARLSAVRTASDATSAQGGSDSGRIIVIAVAAAAALIVVIAVVSIALRRWRRAHS
ncbi:MAG: sialidase family protein [Candidatus Dormibacteria bacterium]